MKPKLCALLSALLFSQFAFATCDSGTLQVEHGCPVLSEPIFVMLTPGDVIYSGSTPGGTGGQGDREGDADCRMECPEDGQLPHPTLECAQSGRQLSCMIWPQGAGLTYFWSHTPGLTLHQPLASESPTQLIDCGVFFGEAVVYIAVQSRGGLRARGERVISCSATGLLVGTIEDPNLPTLPTPMPPDPQM